MTTVLDLFGPSGGGRVVSTDNLCQFPVYLPCPDEDLCTKKAVFSSERNSDESIQRCSPSSKTPIKDASSPGSVELPSMPSEKSSSRDCSDGQCSANCLGASDVTDTDRSNSACSLSPNIKKSEVTVNITSVSSPIHPMGRTIDCILEHLYSPVKCSANRETVATSDGFIPNLTIPSSGLLPEHNSAFARSDQADHHSVPKFMSATSDSNVDYISSVHLRSSHVDPYYYRSLCMVPSTMESPQSSFKRNFSYVYDGYPHSVQFSKSYYNTRNDHTCPANCELDSRLSELPVSVMHVTNLASQESPIQYYDDIRLQNRLSYHSVLSRKSPSNYISNFYRQESTSSSISSSFASVDRNTNPNFVWSRLSSTNNANIDLPDFNYSRHQYIRNGPDICVGLTNDEHKNISNDSCYHSDECLPLNNSNYCKISDIKKNVSNIFPASLKRVSNLPKSLEQYNYGSNFYNNDRLIGSSSSGEKPYVSKTTIKHKRRGSKAADRGGKRRRLSFDKSLGTDQFSPETFVRSILSQNVTQYIRNPLLHSFPYLHPPAPSPRSQCPRKISIQNFDHTKIISGRKYFHFPLSLCKPQTKPTNEDYISRFLSEPNFDDQLLKFGSENFLIDAYKRAVVRNSYSSYISPPTPEVSPSTSTSLLSFFSPVNDEINRMTPPLFSKYANERLFSKLVSPDHLNTISKYTEEVISFDQFGVCRFVTCSNCAMQIIVPKKALIWKHPDKDSLYSFCSSNCLLNYKKQSTPNVTNLEEIISGANLKTTWTDGFKPLSLCLLKYNVSKFTKIYKRSQSHDAKITRRRLINDASSHSRISTSNCTILKRWSGIRWKKCVGRVSSNLAIKNKLYSNLCDTSYKYLSSMPSFVHVDKRICSICLQPGDGSNEVTSRLLNFDVDLWLHLNCILWCYDTYETVSGSLIGVPRSLEKALKTQCTHCKKFGAGLPCFASDCQVIYHLPCAHLIGCAFYPDRGMYCPNHCQNGSSAHQLESLAVDRRVYVDRDEHSQVASVISSEDHLSSTIQPRRIPAKLRIGTLLLHTIGQLLPDQLTSGSFHTSNFIYPVGYCSTRVYWSYRHVNQRCRYTCRIEDSTRPDSDQSKLPCARFIIEVIEENELQDLFEDSTCDGVWQQVLTRINNARKISRRPCLRIFQNHLQGEVLYGLTEPHIIRAIESLPGVDRLSNYMFKFGKLQLIKEMPLAINPTGCARSEPKLRTYVRRKPAGEINSCSHSLHNRKSFEVSGSAISCTDAGSPTYLNSSTVSLISKSQQYRRLSSEWKTNVILARSRIQGLGLYAARDISKHTFIIEYLGEIIRNEVGNRRERLYESQNRGVYMFRVDDDWIVDATMCGGLARYINHSCDPNCSAEILNCDSGSHIVIIANKNIEKGDELTYDYKFDLEEDRWDRIPCLCGSQNCRKWMN